MSSSLTRADASSWQLLEVTTNPIISPPWRPGRQGRCDRDRDCHTPPSRELLQRPQPSSWRDGERNPASVARPRPWEPRAERRVTRRGVQSRAAVTFRQKVRVLICDSALSSEVYNCEP
ncbi:hypothetical protein AAFF_G00154530 [Aldrovandia affinis]|uniref:Uncharacterized protein n=1 Tax=Aldrovandia affinis TaxID=143900 RepID=A0AAD7SZV9_9TELE|nr:hypothetical protein AAFF_G00154530 [Aldrovandia affinis]